MMENQTIPTAYYLRDIDYIDDVTDDYINVARLLTLYVQPIVCVFGFIGNSLSCRIFLSISLRKTSSNIYLASLSASSCLFLVPVALSWLEVIRVPVIHEHVICQLVVFISYVCSFLTVWLVTLITVENYVVTFHLTKARHFCTVRNAKIGLLILTVSAILIYAISLWISKVDNLFGTETKICTVDKRHEKLNEIFTYIDISVTLILPNIIILVLISVILFKNVFQYYFQKCAKHVRRRLTRKEKYLLRITRVLLAISISYAFFSGPTYGNKLRHILRSAISPNSSATLKDHSLQQIFQIFFYCAFCSNYVIYISFCKNYRSCLINMFKRTSSTQNCSRNNFGTMQRQMRSVEGIAQETSQI